MSKRAKSIAVAISACWLPSSALPKVLRPTSIVVAFPAVPNDPDDISILASTLYLLHPDGRLESEEDDEPIPFGKVFWWVEEAALLAGFDALRGA